MNKPIAPTPSITFCGFTLPPNVTIDLDPLDGSHHVLLALTGPGGVTVRVRLWVPEQERADWRRAVEMMNARA